MATKQKDYQYDFVDPLPEECPCVVCLEVQVDPHQVTCCGKIFCKSCLDKLIRGRQNCPNCRKNISSNRFFPDVNIERKINNLQVHCENHTRGCKWVGCLKDLIAVHIPKCPNHLVPCTNIAENDPFARISLNAPECGVSVQRWDLSEHMTQLCKWRDVNCNFCKSKGTYHFINGGHTDSCPDFLVVCSNEGCEIKIKQKDCPEQKTSCPKRCNARENIVSHNQECMELDSALDTVDQTSEDLAGKLKQPDDKLNETQTKLKQTCNTLDQTRKKKDQTRYKLDKRMDSLEGKLHTPEEDSPDDEVYSGDDGHENHCYC